MTKIMIAEDQQLIRESLKIILDSIEGVCSDYCCRKWGRGIAASGDKAC